MGKVNDWLGAVGGTILVLELILLLLVLVGINVGLVLGLRWVRGKTSFVHEKRVSGQSLVTRYVDRGAGLVAAPVIISTSAWRGIKAGLHRITHWPTSSDNRVLLPDANTRAIEAREDLAGERSA